MAKITTPLQFLQWLRPAPWQLFAAKVDRAPGEPWADACTISDEDLGISECVRDKQNPLQYAVRQIQRAKEICNG